MFILRLLHIRCLQCWRIIKTLGVVRTIILLFIIMLLVGSLYHIFKQYPYFSSIVIFAFASLIHHSRKDKRFININATCPHGIFFTEYIVYLSPLLIISVFTVHPAYTALSLLLIFLASLTNIRYKQRTNTFISRFIPKDNFEWISGFRRYPWIVLLYISGLALSFLPYATLLITWLLLLCFISFYEINEPLPVLIVKEYGSGKFLSWKIWLHIKCYTFLLAPLFAIHIIFNYALWYIIIPFAIIHIFCFALVIICKYSAYTPNRYIPANIFTILIITLSNVVLPLLIFTIVFSITSYGHAIQNLNNYLHDFN